MDMPREMRPREVRWIERIRLGWKKKKRKKEKKGKEGYYGYFIPFDYQEKLFCQTVHKTAPALNVNLLHG
jgi:hypothetical protein